VNTLRKRIDKIFLRDANLQAVFVSKKENVRYFSDFTGDDSFLLLFKEKFYFLTDFRYVEQAKIEAKGYEIIDYKGELYKTILELLNEKGIEALYIEGDTVSTNQYFEMIEKLEGINLKRLKFSLDELRIVKDDGEIEKIKKAVELSDLAFEHILKYVKEGISEKDLACELQYFLLKNGSKGFSFDPIIASGKRSSLPHGVPSAKKIERGDFITFDFGCNYDGYMSDMTRTIFLGTPSKEQLKIYNIVKEAQQRAIEYIKESVKCSDVDKLARDYIGSFGYYNNFGHSLGHGVGLEIHELPRLSPKSDAVLTENMVVTVEPGIYIEGFGGVRIEDLVVVKKDGCEVLTCTTKEVIIL